MIRQSIVKLPALLLFSAWAVGASGQSTSCPLPRPDSGECRRFHYHVRLWQVTMRTFTDVSATTVYSSRDACESARAKAQKASQSFAEQIRTSKIDGSFQPDVMGECHCDLTQDPASRTFLDDEARMRQRRALHDAVWQIREKLLGASNPAAAHLLRSLTPVPVASDRFLAEKLPPRGAAAVVDAKPIALLETEIASRTVQPAIASDVALLQLEAPATSAGVKAVTASADPTPPPSRSTSGRAFFDYEAGRLGTIVDASQVLPDAELKSAIRAACDERRQVLANLELVANASGRDSRLVRALEQTASEEQHRALLRALFGTEIAAAWAPADAKDAILRRTLEPRDIDKLLAHSEDAEQRRAAVYFALSRYSALPAAEARALGDVMNALLPEEGRQ